MDRKRPEQGDGPVKMKYRHFVVLGRVSKLVRCFVVGVWEMQRQQNPIVIGGGNLENLGSAFSLLMNNTG